ncbi:zinc-binding dehydrogenase [Fodinicola feengrottensis]|uniref:zinc-binding dehydrogenase n=1 Tax=Fodinicola feengrottensis TaxID=435914 RepID=UPI002442BABE|nr:zinc-binding dehydrogenase [Fodinicola feengrottensis]
MRQDPGLPMPGYQLREAPWGPAVGTVVESRDPALPVGTEVVHRAGWQEYAVLTSAQAYPVDKALPAAYYALNQGVTAYHGIVDIAEVKPGDVVFVSGAAGGVGSLAGQIAKAVGARAKVIGSAGSAAKVDYLTGELGFDAAINYRDGDLLGQLRAAARAPTESTFSSTRSAATLSRRLCKPPRTPRGSRFVVRWLDNSTAASARIRGWTS